MKHKVWSSLRFRLVLYSFISLVMAVVTETIIGLLLYLLSTGMGTAYTGYGMNRRVPDVNKANAYRHIDRIHDRGVWRTLRQIQRMDRPTLYMILVAGLIVGMVLFICYFLLLTRRITRDLSYISGRITKIAEGNLNERIEVKRQDEIGEIAERINEMAQEIQRLMESEREALQTNKDLITCVAHDLRTPLTSVIGYLQLAMETDKYPVEQRQEYARIASQKANRLEGLIQDLFTYTKMVSGEVSLHPCDIDIVKLLEQMEEEFYPLFQVNGLECQMHTNIDSLILHVDPELIARAVQNLLSNAVKYGKDGKQILVFVEKREEEVAISVQNYGLVIPKESLGQIFDKFYRVEESRSRKTGGTGLGLNITKEIILLHGGTIQAQSDVDGTIFTVTLPLNRK